MVTSKTDPQVRFQHVGFGLLLGAALVLAAARAEAAEFLRGDANQDGEVTIADCRCTLSYLFLGSSRPACLPSADVNANGQVDLTDSIGILLYVVGEGTPCPPFPEAGSGHEWEDAACATYEVTAPEEDPASVLRVADAAASADGTVTLEIIVHSTQPVGAVSGVVSVEGDVIADKYKIPFELGFEHPDELRIEAASAKAGKVRFALSGGLSSFEYPIEVETDTILVRLPLCIVEGTAAGSYALRLEEGEIAAPDGSAKVVPTLQGGTLTVGAEAAASASCSATRLPEWPPESACTELPPAEPPPPDPPDPPDPPLPVTELDFSRGDANADGRVSTSDSVNIRRYLFLGGPVLPCFDAADADDNGMVDLTDQIRILTALFLGAPPLPDPTGEIGPDPTPGDGLSCNDFSVSEPEFSDDVLRIGDAAGAPGDVVHIPVFLSNTRPIEAFQLVISYDPSKFTPRDTPHAVSFEGSFFGDVFDTTSDRLPDPHFLRTVTPSDGLLVVGLVPSFISDEYEVPPGDDHLVFSIVGQIPEGIEGETSVFLEPTNGPNSEGTGPYRMLNEVTYHGAARWLSAVPVTVGGELKIGPDIAIFTRGDVNGDFFEDVTDAVLILEHLFRGGPAPSCADAADVNDDGTIEMTDAVVLLWAAFLGTETIRPPYPNPGRDPTPDDLPRCVSPSAKP